VHASPVSALDMRVYVIDDVRTVLLIVGVQIGVINVYRAPLSQLRCFFHCVQKFRAYTHWIYGVHFHRRMRRFVSVATDKFVKIWSLQDMSSAPQLVKRLQFPSVINCAKYSETGLLLTGAENGVLRIHAAEAPFSVLWRVKLPGYIRALAWSTNNLFAASYVLQGVHNRSNAYYTGYGVRVYTSSFSPLFERTNKGKGFGPHNLVFASNNMLFSSVLGTNTVYWYYITNARKTFLLSTVVKTNILPFSRDVINIIMEYVPPRIIDAYTYKKTATGAVTTLDSKVLTFSSNDRLSNMFELHTKRKQLVVSLKHVPSHALVSVNLRNGFMVASAHFPNTLVRVAKITFHDNVGIQVHKKVP